jgi:hypothetical protein
MICPLIIEMLSFKTLKDKMPESRPSSNTTAATKAGAVKEAEESSK